MTPPVAAATGARWRLAQSRTTHARTWSFSTASQRICDCCSTTARPKHSAAGVYCGYETRSCHASRSATESGTDACQKMTFRSERTTRAAAPFGTPVDARHQDRPLDARRREAGARVEAADPRRERREAKDAHISQAVGPSNAAAGFALAVSFIPTGFSSGGCRRLACRVPRSVKALPVQ